MRVQELIEQLSKYNPQALVVVPVAEESDDFAPLQKVVTMLFDADACAWEVYDEGNTDSCANTFILEKAVVLWP